MGLIYLLYIFFDVFPVTLCVLIILTIIFNISLAVFVNSNAKSRNLDNGKIWAILTFFFCLIPAVLYFVLNIKLGTKNKDKKEKKLQKITLIICAATIALSSVSYPIYNYEIKKDTLKSEYEGSMHMPYLNEDESHFVFYDKLGKKYDYIDEDAMPYYTIKGDEFFMDYENLDALDDQDTHLILISKDEKIVIPEEKAAVNSDGYLVELDKSKLKKDEVPPDDYSYDEDWEDYDEYKYVYSDSKGSLYFEPKDCSWDKSGNLVFKSKSLTNYYNKHK